jgi:hypothetical protein
VEPVVERKGGDWLLLRDGLGRPSVPIRPLDVVSSVGKRSEGEGRIEEVVGSISIREGARGNSLLQSKYGVRTRFSPEER